MIAPLPQPLHLKKYKKERLDIQVASEKIISVSNNYCFKLLTH